MLDLNSSEKVAAEELIKAAIKIFDVNKLKKNITLEQWLLDIKDGLLKIVDTPPNKD